MPGGAFAGQASEFPIESRRHFAIDVVAVEQRCHLVALFAGIECRAGERINFDGLLAEFPADLIGVAEMLAPSAGPGKKSAWDEVAEGFGVARRQKLDAA